MLVPKLEMVTNFFLEIKMLHQQMFWVKNAFGPTNIKFKIQIFLVPNILGQKNDHTVPC